MSNLVIFILILQILVFIVNSFLGILVFQSESKSRFNILFCVFTLSLALWNLALFFTIAAIGGPVMQLWCSRLAFSFGVILFNSFLYFASIYPNVTRVRLWLDIVIGLGTAAIFYLTLTPSLIKGNIVIINGAITGEVGALMPIFSLYLPLFIIISLVTLIWKLFKYRGVVRVRIWYTLIGFVFFAVPMIITNLILPIFFGNFSLNNLGPIFSLPMVATIAYVMVRHRFMGIRQAVARLVTYFFVITFLGFFYAAGVWVMTALIVKGSGVMDNLWVSILFAVVASFSFQPLRSSFEKTTNRMFYQHHYDGNRLLYNLALIMSSSLRLKDLTSGLINQIMSEMHIARGAFILVGDKRISHLSYGGYEQEPVFTEKELSSLASQSKIVIFDELPENSLKKVMRDLRIKALLPLRTKKAHNNILILGEKLSGEPYSVQDVSLLEVFAPSAAVAINNTVSIEQIIRLDDLKSEFITVVSHQLRTPLSVARWNFELLLDGSFGEINKEVKNFATTTYQAVMDLNKGLNNLMLSLEIEENKLIIKFDAVDFSRDIIDEVLKSCQKELAFKGITVDKSFGFKKEVKIDSRKILEAVKALLSNAIEYSPAGSRIKITTSLLRKDKGNELLFTICDQGSGIPEENKKFIFQKFFRGEMAKKISPNGFGLSLFIARSFVESHGGVIWLENQKTPGAAFSFTLPLK